MKKQSSWLLVLTYVLFALIDVFFVFWFGGLFLIQKEIMVFILLAKLIQHLIPVIWVSGRNDSVRHRDLCEAFWALGASITWGIVIWAGAIIGYPNIVFLFMYVVFWNYFFRNLTRKYMAIRPSV